MGAAAGAKVIGSSGADVEGVSGKVADGGSTRDGGGWPGGTTVAISSGGEVELACGCSASGDERSGRWPTTVEAAAAGAAAVVALDVRLSSCGRVVQSSSRGPAAYEAAEEEAASAGEAPALGIETSSSTS